MARDDAVSGESLGVQPKIGRAVLDERVRLDERSRVQQEPDPLARGQFPLRVLGCDTVFPAAFLRKGLPPAQLLDALVARHGRAQRGGVSLTLRGRARAGRNVTSGFRDSL